MNETEKNPPRIFGGENVVQLNQVGGGIVVVNLALSTLNNISYSLSHSLSFPQKDLHSTYSRTPVSG